MIEQRRCRISIWHSGETAIGRSGVTDAETNVVAKIYRASIALEFSIAPRHAGLVDVGMGTRSELLATLDEICKRENPNSWHAHVFVVDTIEDNGRRPLGLMFDDRPSGRVMSGTRRGCAISMRMILAASRGDPARYRRLVARTLAHELGHVFNLDHDELPSVMTPLSWYGTSYLRPGRLTMDLSETQEHWLRHGEELQVRPGGGAYHGRGARMAPAI